jgi:hypothetical protein
MKDPAELLMARGARPTTGRGFQIVLSRSFVGEASPSISALEVAFLFIIYIISNFATQHSNVHVSITITTAEYFPGTIPAGFL